MRSVKIFNFVLKMQPATETCRGMTDQAVTQWVSGGIGRVHRASGAPPTAAISLYRRELTLEVITGLFEDASYILRRLFSASSVPVT
jgi:hypothetical protein